MFRLEDLREASSSVVMEMLAYAAGSDLSPRQGDQAIKRRRKRGEENTLLGEIEL